MLQIQVFFKGCMPAESRCHCAGKPAAGEWRVGPFFLTGSILTIFFHMGQGDPAKTSQFTIIELRPAPILLKPPLSGSALFSYMLNQGWRVSTKEVDLLFNMPSVKFHSATKHALLGVFSVHKTGNIGFFCSWGSIYAGAQKYACIRLSSCLPWRRESVL